jgi:hypothetical protein
MIRFLVEGNMLKWIGAMALWGGLVSLPHVTDALGGARFPRMALAIAGVDQGSSERGAGQYAKLRFHNELGKVMTVVEAQFTLDGKPLPVLTDVKSGTGIEVFSGQVSPGHHFVKTRLVCRGNDRGPVTYLKDYRWIVNSDEVLTVPEGRAVLFTVTAQRTKNISQPLEKQIRIVVRNEEIPGGAPLTN